MRDARIEQIGEAVPLLEALRTPRAIRRLAPDSGRESASR